MQRTSILFSTVVGIVVVLVSGQPALTQAPPGAYPDVVNPVGLRFLDVLDGQSFTATAVISSRLGGAFQDLDSVKARYRIAIAGRDYRAELDLADVSTLTADQIDVAKRVGVDKVVVVVRGAETMVVYPNAQSYIVAPFQEAPATIASRSPAGKDTCGGKECARETVIVRRAGGTEQWTVWRHDGAMVQLALGADLTADGARAATIQFEDVARTVPPAGSFAVPATYRRFKTRVELMNWLSEKIPPSR